MRNARRNRTEQTRRRGALGLTALGLLALGLAAVAIWSAAALAGATSPKGTVSLGNTDLGRVLVNSRGRTLYLFLKDRNGKSACAGTCAQYWPPLIARGKPAAGAGVKAAWLATVRRADGRMQVTYRRHPLYAFALDKRAGQTSGEGRADFGAKWYAVSASGAAVRKATSVGASSSTTTTTPYPNPYP